MTETELLKLKKEITEASEKVSELKGQRALLTKQLKEKWGVTTPKEGKAKLDSMQTAIDKKDKAIEKRTEELQTQLDESDASTEE